MRKPAKVTQRKDLVGSQLAGEFAVTLADPERVGHGEGEAEGGEEREPESVDRVK